jgi:hypothetical protein
VAINFVPISKFILSKYFDVILGYDWLATFSPIQVHWSEKWMAIPNNAEIVVLHGIISELKDGALVQVFQLTEEDLKLDTMDILDHAPDVPPGVQKLLLLYAEVFATKVTYPPPKLHSHTIPLISSARPVNIRPYRYAPSLKSEIERQVQEMLDSGLIQHSTCPFNSAVG